MFIYGLPVTSVRPPGQSWRLWSPALIPGRAGWPTRRRRAASGRWSWTDSINASRRWTATRLTTKLVLGGGVGCFINQHGYPSKGVNGTLQMVPVDSETFYIYGMASFPSGHFCSRNWDGWLCWDDTPAGTSSAQFCPSYFIDFDPTG